MAERNKKKAKVSEALRACGDDKDVMLAAAKLFFIAGKVDKSRKWFNKITELYPKFADAWIYYYKLETIWGTEKSAKRVLTRFIILNEKRFDPFNSEWNYSKEWRSFKDKIDNWGLIDEELLNVIVKKENIDVGHLS